jgi:cytochrome c-type biogenesis protein CcmH
MNLFIGLAALLTLLVVAWFIHPLFRSPKSNGVSAEKLNVSIHRDQLSALETDLARGIISQQDFETTRDELQLRLLDDTESFEASPKQSTTGFWSSKRTAAALAVSLPVMTFGIYLQLGTPAAINPVASTAASVNDPQVQKMIDSLVAKLKANPDNPEGWAMLARSYKVVGRLPEALQAYEKAGQSVHNNPDILVDYAEILAMQANNNFIGEPKKLVDEALALNPQHPMALMMAGVAAYQHADFTGAVTIWTKLLALLPPDSPDAQQIQANIADAQSKAGQRTGESNQLPPVPEGTAAAMTPDNINQMVDRLAERLKNNPNDLAGWARLARAYKVQGRQEDAAKAYAKTGKLMDSDPDLLTQYADLLAMQTKTLQGKPSELVNKALSLDPKHPMALMMAAQAAYQSGQYTKAISHWETALTTLPTNSPDAEQIKAEITDAKLKAGTAQKP